MTSLAASSRPEDATPPSRRKRTWAEWVGEVVMWPPLALGRLVLPLLDAQVVPGAPDLTAERPSRKDRVFGFVTAVSAIGVLLATHRAVPWMTTSPARVLQWALELARVPSDWARSLSWSPIILLIVTMRKRDPEEGGLYALISVHGPTQEEAESRWGVEGQSWPRRLWRQVVFGLAHLPNWIYSVAAVGLVTVIGVLLMVVYLVNARSGGPEAGLRASTRLHQAHNRAVLPIALVVLVGWSLWRAAV